MYIYPRNIFENVNYAKKYLKLNDINLDNEKYIELKDILKKSLGYLGIWTEWMFENNIDIQDMKRLYSYFKDPKFKDFTKDLNLDDYQNIEQIYDYLTKKYQDRQVEQIIKSLPSKTRKLTNENLKELIFNNLEYYTEIKDFYSKKGGRYKNIKDLIYDTKSFIENLKGPWNSNEIAKNLSKEEIIYKDDQTLIAWIQTYERSCSVGSKSWCISTDKYHFESYTKYFKKQYFIWDFTKDISDKKSLIGVTIDGSGKPSSIHFKDDSMGSIEDIKDYLKWLKPYNKEYIESKINLNDWDEVIEVGILKFVKNLIDKGFDPSIDDNYAIQLASYNGHTEVVKLLLDDPRVDPTVGNNFAIRMSSEYNHPDVVKLLLQDERVDPSTLNNYAVRWSSYKGHTKVVKMLLDDPRVDPSAKDNYAIMSAADHGHTEVVKLLLDDPRVDPTAIDNQAIRWASFNAHTEVVKVLLDDPRVDPTVEDNWAIKSAAHYGHTEVVKLLLDDPRVRKSLTPEEIEKYNK